MQLKKKNFVIFDMRNTLLLEKNRNSFIVRKIKKIFLNWNIDFFRWKNFQKNKINIAKINFYKNSFIFYFSNWTDLTILLNENKEIWKKKLIIKSVNYNGYFLNWNYLKKCKEIFFEKYYFLFYINFLIEFMLKVIIILLLKVIYYIRFNYLILK